MRSLVLLAVVGCGKDVPLIAQVPATPPPTVALPIAVEPTTRPAEPTPSPASSTPPAVDCEKLAAVVAQVEAREKPWNDLREKAMKVCTLGTLRGSRQPQTLGVKDGKFTVYEPATPSDMQIRVCPSGSPRALWNAANCGTRCREYRSDEEAAAFERYEAFCTKRAPTPSASARPATSPP